MKYLEYNFDVKSFNYKTIKTKRGIVYYLDNGKSIHHDYLPSFIYLSSSGTNSYLWFDYGLLYRKSRPAYIRTDKKNKKNIITSLTFHESNNLAPNERFLDLNFFQNIVSTNNELYSLPFNTLKHNNSSPSFSSLEQLYFNKGIFEEYYKNGLLHREDGPAVIWMDDNQKTRGGLWYLEGKKIK